MEQLTLVNILLLCLGLLINATTHLRRLHNEDKRLHFGLPLALTLVTNVAAAFAGLFMAKDMLGALGATANPEGWFYAIHAFGCGLLPQVIIDRARKLFLGSKKQ